MPTYRFYFMHRGHSISLAKNHDFSGDDEARLHAIDLLKTTSNHEAIEIWDLGRFVARHERGAG
jgi:hypothetical protein